MRVSLPSVGQRRGMPLAFLHPRAVLAMPCRCVVHRAGPMPWRPPLVDMALALSLVPPTTPVYALEPYRHVAMVADRRSNGMFPYRALL